MKRAAQIPRTQFISLSLSLEMTSLSLRALSAGLLIILYAIFVRFALLSLNSYDCPLQNEP